MPTSVPPADGPQALRAAHLERFKLDCPPELPISEHVDEIAALLREHQVVVVAGETGSGKTTQLPKVCLRAGLGVRGSIAHTQPRRLAARSVATRIAEEVGAELGTGVGYAVRFDDRVADDTVIKLVTDGLLLTEVRRDRDLRRYEVVIVDEAHERSLNIDFLLGVLRRAVKRRPDLKVIVTSATIDVARFSEYFGGAPVVEIGGRGYPVSVRYLDDVNADDDAEVRLIGAVEAALAEPFQGAQDILAFQTGEREIFESAKRLREHFGARLEVLPLYARLRAGDQAKIFRPGKQRRLVLATNVAETSLTVPNIGFVIDPGYARINRYSYRSKLERLPVEPVAQANANQRAGRCGRVSPGVCFRLYTEEDFNNRPAFADPEIRRVNLASVVLTMRAFRLGDIQKFGFIEPPDPRAVRDAIRLLEELGALRDNQLTNIGRAMSRLPVDPRLARMLVAASSGNALAELLVIVSALAVQDPRERPFDARAKADAKHERFLDERSDFYTLLNLWSWLNNLKASASRSGERKSIVAHFLNPARVREWRALHRQLALAVRDLGWRQNTVPASREEVASAVLAGSLSLIGTHDEKGVYHGARGSKFRVFPGSVLHGATPKWVVAAEIAETARVYARTVCEVQPRWIETHAGHLVKRQHHEPHWSGKSGEAHAYERVTLYGLTLVERRRVRLAKHDPALARELFIREGFLAGQVPKKVRDQVPCIEQNAREIAAVRDFEAKGRRRDIMISDEEMHAYVDARLPAEVLDGTTLVRWWRGADDAARRAIQLSADVLLRQSAVGLGEDAYPSRLKLGDLTVNVSYRFSPGSADDGVNVTLPVGMVQGVSPELLEWSVPGYLPQIVEGWLRTLPKSRRRQLAPIADRVPGIVAFLLAPKRYRQGRLRSAMVAAVQAESNLSIEPSEWAPERVDPLLQVNVRLVGRRGKLVDQGRDLAELQAKHAEAAQTAVDLTDPIETDLKAFPAELPSRRTVRVGGVSVLVHPALKDEQGRVDLVYAESAEAAALINRGGYSRLALTSLRARSRYFRREIERHKELGLQFATLGDAAMLRDALLMYMVWQCYFENGELPRDRAAFDARLEAGRHRLTEVFEACLNAFAGALAARFELMNLLQDVASPAYESAVADVRRTVDRLMPSHVLEDVPMTFLERMPQYLAAQRYRLENLQGKVKKDRQSTETLKGFESRVDRLRAHRLAPRSAVLTLTAQLEEVRVGLFAEPLALKGQGSAKKLDRALETLEREIGLI